MFYTRPQKRQSKNADAFDRIAIQFKLKHDEERKRLSAPAQFNCEGCNG